jgi:6,7-dimethyl-8-ribityllumazine synthase
MTGGLPTIDLPPPSGRFAIIASRFNEQITGPLLAACRATLARHDVGDDRVSVFRVPGAFEIPVTARAVAETRRYSAVICLGCVVRGDTDHYEHVAGQAAAGVMQAGLASGVPVIFGILTTQTMEQALERAGPNSENKGVEAALAAIEMANLFAALGEGERAGFGFGRS